MTGSGSGYSGSGSGYTGSGGSDMSGEVDCYHWTGYMESGSGSGSGSGDEYIDLYPVNKGCGCDCGGDFEEHIKYGFAKKREWDNDS